MQQQASSNNEVSRLLRLPDVLSIFPVSRSSWWAGVKDGRYPAGIKIGPRSTAWQLSDIQELILSLSEAQGKAK